jgi:hypothetical protein
MRERGIEEAWVEVAVRRPGRCEPDEADPALEHRLRRIETFGNRVLRVVTREEPPHVVTAFFDRSLRGDPSL